MGSIFKRVFKKKIENNDWNSKKLVGRQLPNGYPTPMVQITLSAVELFSSI